MEKTNKKIIALALILSLITSALIYSYITSQNKGTAMDQEIEYATVYTAVRTIAARSEITAADVGQTKVAKELVSANALTNVEDIIGKRTLESIIQGEQILRERLADEKTMTLSYFIPEGTRAISINVNEQIDVANLLRPGDYVDVIASFEKEEEENGQTTKYYPRITKMILQNVKVLALGQDVKLSSDKLKELPATVTLAIEEGSVEKFVFASEYGTLRLALRPVDDTDELSSQGIIRSDMTGNKGVYSRASDKN